MRSRTALTLVLLVIVAGCAGGVFQPRANDNPYYEPGEAKFFTGTQGVETGFETVPRTLFFYADDVGGESNTFPLTVYADNMGASYSRGAVFLSGYDPGIIQFDEVPITGQIPGACSMRLGDYSAHGFGMSMQCGEGFSWSGDEDNWLRSLTLRGSTIFEDTWFEDFDMHYESQGDWSELQVNYDGALLEYDKRAHGKMLIALLGGLNFQKLNGRDFLLAGNSYTYPGGQVEYFDYNGRIIDWPEGADQMQQHFMLTSCYLYTTFAAPMVCIDPSPYSDTRKVCSPQAISWSSGNGAPIAITQVRQENTPRTAAFHITVENRGRGTVFNPGSLEKCSPYFPGGARRSDLNTVWLGEVRINDQRLRCTPEREVRLQNGRAQFTCLYNLEYAQINSAYQTPLVIELWYGYSETFDHQLLVKRVI